MRRRTAFTIAAVLAAALTAAATGGATAPEPEGAAPPGDMIGQMRHVVAAYEDTLLDLARANGLGYVEMIAANRASTPGSPARARRSSCPPRTCSPMPSASAWWSTWPSIASTISARRARSP